MEHYSYKIFHIHYKKKYLKKLNNKLSTELGIVDTREKGGFLVWIKLKFLRLFLGYNSQTFFFFW